MSTPLGIEATTDDDRRYGGSRFADVRDALWANPYQRLWGAPGEGAFPVHKVTLASVLQGLLRPGHYAFLRAAERTVDAASDLRWGPDRKGFRRLLHPNGICLTGTWRITVPPKACPTPRSVPSVRRSTTRPRRTAGPSSA